MKNKCVVLLSGGLDSTVNLYKAHSEQEVALAITCNYGQRAFEKELQAAKKMTDHLGIPHKVIDLSWFREFTSTSLVSTEMAVPTGEDVLIDDLSQSQKTAKSVWVPNRNGILLNVAAGFAEGLGANSIIPGFNKEEATTFPDNSSDFMKAMERSLSFSTANEIQVQCYTVDLNKTEIVRLGKELGVEFDWVWSCYFAEKEKCGKCESCQRFERAIKEA